MATTLTVMSSSFAHKLFTVTSTWRLTAAYSPQIDSFREATRAPQQGDQRANLLRPACRQNPPVLV